MKSEQFCFWLQGFFELARPEAMTSEQTELIKRHLDMVFLHEITPSFPEAQHEALDKLHHPAGVLEADERVMGVRGRRKGDDVDGDARKAFEKAIAEKRDLSMPSPFRQATQHVSKTILIC